MSQMRNPQHPKIMVKALSARWRRHMLVADTRQKVIKLSAISVLFLGGAIAIAQPELWRQLGDVKNDVVAQIKARPELMIHGMDVSGGSDILEAELMRDLNLEFPISRLDVDLDVVAAQVKGYSAVHDVAVQITPEGVLQVILAERVPAFVWLARDGFLIVDQEGEVLGTVGSRHDMPHLPLLIDDGAPSAVFEAQMILDRLAHIGSDVTGLRRIGERRWNVLLSHGRQVYLPADDPETAVDTFVNMTQSDDLLSRDFAHLDLRLAHRPTIRARSFEGEQLVHGQAQVE